MKRILTTYNDFKILENMSLAKSIVNKKMEDFEKLKDLLSKNTGYMGKFTEFLFKEDVPYSELTSLYNKLKELKSNSYNIDINDLNYEEVIDKIQVTEENISIKRVIKEFPSHQKKLLKNMESSLHGSSLRMLLINLSKKRDITAFTSKISRYKTSDELLKAIQIFSKNAKNDRETVKKTVEKLKSHVVYEDDDIMIVYVDSSDDVKILGSDTSWCILSQHMWKSYVHSGNKQFIIYDYRKNDFDPDFKVGVTVTPDGGIRAAHDILDKSVHDKVSQIIKNKTTLSKIHSEVSKKDYIKKADFKEGTRIRHIKYGDGIIAYIDNEDPNIVYVEFDNPPKKERNDAKVFNNKGEDVTKKENRQLTKVEKSDIVKWPKLTPSTPIKTWLKISKFLSPDESLEWAVKFLDWRKTDSSKYTVISELIKQGFRDSKYISRNYIKNIDERLVHYSYNSKNILDEDKIIFRDSNSENIDSIFMDAFKNGFWSDEVISQINDRNFLNSILEIRWGGDQLQHISKENMKTIYDKMIEVYDKKLEYKNRWGRNVGLIAEAVQYSVMYEATLVVLSKYLNIVPKGQFKRNYEKILNDKNVNKILNDYHKIVQLPIDLENDYVNLGRIPYVIKKDYENPFNIRFHQKGVDRSGAVQLMLLYEKLMEHLDGYKMVFEISYDQISGGFSPWDSHKTYIDWDNYKYVPILKEMIEELKSMKVPKKGTEIKRGKITLRLKD